MERMTRIAEKNRGLSAVQIPNGTLPQKPIRVDQSFSERFAKFERMANNAEVL